MLAVLETLLCLSLIASFSGEIPWWSQVPPLILLLTPLRYDAQYISATAAIAAFAIAMWAVIANERDQPQTMVVFAILSAMVAPRPCSPISDCPKLQPTNKFD